MDRQIQDNLEHYLHGLDRKEATPLDTELQRQLSAADAETQRLVELMATQARLLRTLRTTEIDEDECTPAPGFYARVMQCIDAQRPASIWNLFIEPRFFHRLAFATFSLLVLLGVTFVSSNYLQEPPVQAHSEPEMILAAPEPTPVTSVGQTEGRDVMLRQLTVYSE
ncbi:MAG TPA: hypothetical protein VFB63_10455 [Bryobacteraceae bacterium]|nr:hypothetical protein [Bryobacteraceae bacterium]